MVSPNEVTFSVTGHRDFNMKWGGGHNSTRKRLFLRPPQWFLYGPMNDTATVTGMQALLGVNNTDFLVPGSSGNCPVPYFDSGRGQHLALGSTIPQGQQPAAWQQEAYTGPLPSHRGHDSSSWNRRILDRDVAWLP